MNCRAWMTVTSLTFAAVALFPLAAGAQDCAPQAFPQVAQGIAAWEVRTGAIVMGAVKREVLDEFCKAAQEVIDEKKADKGAIDGAAQQIVSEYLDREADSKRTGRSIGAIMRTEFKAAGFSRPQVKRRVRVSFKYTRDVDEIKAGSETFPKATALLLPAGTILIQALLNTAVVCSKQLDLKPGVDAEFGC
jgi:hypothetical protein